MALLSTLSKVLKETRSDTAMEFAMVGTVLFLFLFGIILMGVVQFQQMVLDDSVRNATRQLQINPALTSQSFVADVCNEFAVAATNCAGSLQYVVQTASESGTASSSAFGSITPATLASNGTLAGSNSFATLAAGNAILVQVAYKLPFIIPLIPAGFETENGSSAILSSVAVIAEP